VIIELHLGRIPESDYLALVERAGGGPGCNVYLKSKKAVTKYLLQLQKLHKI
jgi:hypothetical protein